MMHSYKFPRFLGIKSTSSDWVKYRTNINNINWDLPTTDEDRKL